MGYILNDKEKAEFLEKNLQEKEKDPVYQHMLKLALERQKERLLKISDSHKMSR